MFIIREGLLGHKAEGGAPLAQSRAVPFQWAATDGDNTHVHLDWCQSVDVDARVSRSRMSIMTATEAMSFVPNFLTAPAQSLTWMSANVVGFGCSLCGCGAATPRSRFWQWLGHLQCVQEPVLSFLQ